MAQQLVLLERNVSDPGRDRAVWGPVDWRLDEHTREVGRQGIAAARRALAQAGGAARAGSDLGRRHAA